MLSGSLKIKVNSPELYLGSFDFFSEIGISVVDVRGIEVTCDFVAFWMKYSILPSDQKIFYEVIRSESPCRLYFDLEVGRWPMRLHDRAHIFRKIKLES